jgi:hypothetical protein
VSHKWSVASLKALEKGGELDTLCIALLEGPMSDEVFERILTDLEREADRGGDLDRPVDWSLIP